jgi:hypothetical protein
MSRGSGASRYEDGHGGDTRASSRDLEADHWGEPNSDATRLVRECHRLRKVPVGQLTVGDLRLLLLQDVRSDWLIPLALDRLQGDPLAGDLYPGALLNAVLAAGPSYWTMHPTETISLWGVRQALEQFHDDTEKLLMREDWPAFG